METGHAKNVANFETIIIILVGLGANYNPSQSLILLSALQDKLTEAKNALAAVDAAEAGKTAAIDEIQAEAENLDKYAVNIKRAVEVEINDAAFTADIQSIVNRYASSSRDTGLPDDPSTPEDESRTTRSTSQRSRDNQIAYLADIAALIRTRAPITNRTTRNTPSRQSKPNTRSSSPKTTPPKPPSPRSATRSTTATGFSTTRKPAFSNSSN